MGSVDRLIEDLKAARVAAERAARQTRTDSGSCNFDSIALWLPPRTRRRVVGLALHAAGLRGFKKSRGSSLFLIWPPAGGQGSRRTAQARAMQTVLEKRGYRAFVHYVMD